MLYPESRDLGFELLQLSREHDVMAVRKCVVQLGTPLSGALDLELDVFDCSHAYINDEDVQDIPRLLVGGFDEIDLCRRAALLAPRRRPQSPQC